MDEPLKTISCGYSEEEGDDSLAFVFCWGHVDGARFEKARQEEGWSEENIEEINNNDPHSLFYHGWVQETKEPGPYGSEAVSYKYSREEQPGYREATIRVC